METAVYWIPAPWPGRLGIVPRPRGGDWLQDDVRSWHEIGLDVVVSLLTKEEAAELNLEDEAECCKAQGLKYKSYPIADRGVPASRATLGRLLKELSHALVSGENVGVHCRQGIGRSALVAAALLATEGESPDNALHKIEAARGHAVPDTDEQRRWISDFASALAGAKSDLG